MGRVAGAQPFSTASAGQRGMRGVGGMVGGGVCVQPESSPFLPSPAALMSSLPSWVIPFHWQVFQKVGIVFQKVFIKFQEVVIVFQKVGILFPKTLNGYHSTTDLYPFTENLKVQ